MHAVQIPASPQRASRGHHRLLQLCPKTCHRSPSSSHDDATSIGEASAFRPNTGRPRRPTLVSRQQTTPEGRMRIYDDLRSPTRQPQTPEQLPEARHQSRLPNSYTAPAVSRFRSAHASSREPGIARRLQIRRGPSPSGMRASGFEGLYGGRENDDDIALFDEAAQARGEEFRAASPSSRHDT